MLVEAANRLNISVLVLDSGADGPAKQISSQPHLDGPFSSASHIQQLADQVDVLTVEIEHVDVTALRELQRTRKQLKIYPSPDLIGLIQTKAMQKDYLQKRGFPVPDLFLVQGKDLHQTVGEAIAKLGLPLMLKSSTMAYDGKGNFLLRSEDDIDRALEFLGNGSRPLFAEAYAPFVREIAVMVVRSADGITATYPAVETIHKENICHLVHAPLRSKRNGTARKAQDLARNAVDALNTLDGQGAVGVFGVEMFEMADGRPFRLFERELI
jgi:phosphoribosylaminoimidazole carboxylase